MAIQIHEKHYVTVDERVKAAEEIAKPRMQGFLGGSMAPATMPVQETSVAHDHFCTIHQMAMKDRGEGVWDHRLPGTLDKQGHLVRNDKGVWYWCQGAGWHVSAN